MNNVKKILVKDSNDSKKDKEILRGKNQKHSFRQTEDKDESKDDSSKEELNSFRGEKDDSYKDEQRAKQIGEVGDEVDIIVEHDSLQRRVILGELRQILINIEHNRYGDDENNREEIGTDKLTYDIPVEPLDVAEGVKHAKPAELAAQPGKSGKQPA